MNYCHEQIVAKLFLSDFQLILWLLVAFFFVTSFGGQASKCRMARAFVRSLCCARCTNIAHVIQYAGTHSNRRNSFMWNTRARRWTTAVAATVTASTVGKMRWFRDGAEKKSHTHIVCLLYLARVPYLSCQLFWICWLYLLILSAAKEKKQNSQHTANQGENPSALWTHRNNEGRERAR